MTATIRPRTVRCTPTLSRSNTAVPRSASEGKNLHMRSGNTAGTIAARVRVGVLEHGVAMPWLGRSTAALPLPSPVQYAIDTSGNLQ